MLCRIVDNMNTLNNAVEVIEKWQHAGDRVYGAIRTGLAPSGTATRLVNGNEYPVASLNLRVTENNEIEYSILRWITRGESF